jgi:hypothetical protein
MRGATERDKLQANQQIEVAYWEACVRSYQAFPQLRMINQPYCAACDTPMCSFQSSPTGLVTIAEPLNVRGARK